MTLNLPPANRWKLSKIKYNLVTKVPTELKSLIASELKKKKKKQLSKYASRFVFASPDGNVNTY